MQIAFGSLAFVVVQGLRELASSGPEDPLAVESVAALALARRLGIQRFAIVAQAHLDTTHLHQFKQLVGRSVSKRVLVLEIHQSDQTHPAGPGSRDVHAVVAKQPCQSEEEVVEILVTKLGLGGEGRREVDVATIQAVNNPVLAAHRAVSAAFLWVLLVFARDRTTSNGRVERKHLVEAFRKGELERPRIWP